MHRLPTEKALLAIPMYNTTTHMKHKHRTSNPSPPLWFTSIESKQLKYAHLYFLVHKDMHIHGSLEHQHVPSAQLISMPRSQASHPLPSPALKLKNSTCVHTHTHTRLREKDQSPQLLVLRHAGHITLPLYRADAGTLFCSRWWHWTSSKTWLQSVKAYSLITDTHS